MNHASGMGVSDRLADLLEDGEKLAEVTAWIGPIVQQPRQRSPPLTSRMVYRTQAGIEVEFVDGKGSRVLKRGHGEISGPPR